MTVEDGWSKCDVLCGIGYQFRQASSLEIRRCLGIDCENPEQLESNIACSGVPLLIVGLFIGLLIIPVVYGFKTYLLPRIQEAIASLGQPKEKKTKAKGKSEGSKRPPAPIPRTEKTKGGGDDEEHVYEEIDEIRSKKPKDSDRYVTMTSKPTKKKQQSQTKPKKMAGDKGSNHGYLDPKEINKPKKMAGDKGSNHGYLDPKEINKPGSEKREIEKLREAPPPPKTKDKKTANSKIKKGASSHNEYETPRQNDYLEIE